ncbi:hypothetical protein KAJ89_03230 [Candidatus Parcubacteria bacterium]|nr:hypothetical protein [Candidatus Parcubacteria bacterium]
MKFKEPIIIIKKEKKGALSSFYEGMGDIVTIGIKRFTDGLDGEKCKRMGGKVRQIQSETSPDITSVCELPNGQLKNLEVTTYGYWVGIPISEIDNVISKLNKIKSKAAKS